MTQSERWARPFIAGYASHTSCFLATQILTLSRVFMAIETEYSLKVNVLLILDLAALCICIVGLIQTFPYIKQVFQAQEIMVNGGPSLITEIIPNLILSITLLTTTVTLFYADYTIRLNLNFHRARFFYIFIGLVGLVVAILSVHDYRERVIAAATIICSCLSGTQWFSDFGLIVPVATACLLLAFISFRESQNLTNLATNTEIEIFRVKTLFLVILALSILTSFVQPFGIMSLVIVFMCNGFLYIQERRFGSMPERQLETTV